MRVELSAYDPCWPTRFRQECTLLEQALAPWLVARIEHVGSTAVAGLPAKPVIDIMAPVRTLAASRDAIAAAQAVGYVYYPYKAELMHWLCKPSPQCRTHHLHLVPYRSRLWDERLVFRDALRGDPEVAAEYAALKRTLAERHTLDREAYTEGKAVFVQQVLARLLP